MPFKVWHFVLLRSARIPTLSISLSRGGPNTFLWNLTAYSNGNPSIQRHAIRITGRKRPGSNHGISATTAVHLCRPMVASRRSMFRWERFLTKRQTSAATTAASNANTNNSVSQASDVLLADMTPSEIQSHRDELFSLLSDDAIAFLKQRGSKAKSNTGLLETRHMMPPGFEQIWIRFVLFPVFIATG